METLLFKSIVERGARLKVLTQFEERHRPFFLSVENAYFLGHNGAVVFDGDCRSEVRKYFGPDDWRICLGADSSSVLEKTVDDVRLVLVGRPDAAEQINL